MLDTKFRLNLYSGKIGIDLKITFRDTTDPTLVTASAPWNFYVHGKHETQPRYCNVSLESEPLSDLRMNKVIMVSQAVIDSILSSQAPFIIKGTGRLLDASEPKVVIDCDIGLQPSEQATLHVPNCCKFYNAGPTQKSSDTPLIRNKSTDLGIALLYYHYSHTDKDGWNDPLYQDFLPTWKKLVNTRNPTEYPRNNPWNYVDEQKEKHRDGLLLTTLALHDSTQLVRIQNSEKHECMSHEYCLLNLLTGHFPQTFKPESELSSIIEVILTKTFNSIYFSHENTVLGLSLIWKLEDNYQLIDEQSAFENLIPKSIDWLNVDYCLKPEGTVTSLAQLKERRATIQSGKPTETKGKQTPPKVSRHST